MTLPNPRQRSSLFGGGDLISGTVLVPVGADGQISVWSSTPVDVVIQTVGWYKDATETWAYTYSGDGLRRTKTAPDGTIITFAWDRSGNLPLLVAETIDAPGTSDDRTVRYVYGPGGRVLADITEPASGPEVLRWYHQDQLGSTIALTNQSGDLVATYDYTPFGEVAASTGTDTTPIGWAGEYRDDETGFTYLRARHYDPTTGQFLTRDPLETISGSPYGYAWNNPVNHNDPTGMLPGLGDILAGIGTFLMGDSCGDGLLGVIGKAASTSIDAIGDAARFAAELTSNNWRTWTLIGAAGACVISTGGALCPTLLLGGFGGRSAATLTTHGFTAGSLRTISIDAVLTSLGMGLSGAIQPATAQLRAGPVVIPPMSTAAVRGAQAIWAPFDVAAISWVPNWLP